jgi:hypothetical protein
MNSLSALRLPSLLHSLEQYLTARAFAVNWVLHIMQVLLGAPSSWRRRCLRLLCADALLHFFVQYAASLWWGVNVLPHPAHCF